MAERPDPVRDLDWTPAQARELGEGALGIWERYLSELPDLPIRRRDNVVKTVRDGVLMPLPDEPLSLDELLDHARRVLLEYSVYPGHPGFMAYVTGPGTVPGVVGDMLAAAVNQNVGAWRLAPAATEIELHLTKWFASRFGLPDTGGGFLTSGGAMANFVGLKVARDRHAGFDPRFEGMANGNRLAIYASEEIHAVTDRAADMIGIGMSNVRKIPTDDAFRIRIDALNDAITSDVRNGVKPVAVVASTGTVNTGAIDPFKEIAEVCAQNDMWFHVDGAYGGPAIFAEDLRPAFEGIELADSIAFDPHKWLYTPHSGGCILFRDLQNPADSFGGLHPTYTHEDKETAGTGLDIGMLGPQFSRGFQAFKVWLSFLAHGTKAYSRRISHDAELARYMGELVVERPGFELATPVSLSICCFRYVPEDLAGERGDEERETYLNSLNERIMTELQLDGRSFCSNAVLRGRFVLRACIVNFRTEAPDVERTIDVAAEIGARLDSEMRPAGLR